MECRPRLIKKGVKHQVQCELPEAEKLFTTLHHRSRANPFFHTLSHIFLMSVALQRKDKAEFVEQIWLAGCAPIASTGFAIHTFLKKIR
jgi:hypothetical protein